MRQTFRTILLLAMLVALPCALSAATSTKEGASLETIPAAWLEADFLLLGEVHDNSAGHALRLRWLQQLVQQRRVALVFEQFDLESQTALDQAVQQWQTSNQPADDRHQRPSPRQPASTSRAGNGRFMHPWLPWR
jgi:uncharacterized iron-regulated protein